MPDPITKYGKYYADLYNKDKTPTVSSARDIQTNYYKNNKTLGESLRDAGLITSSVDYYGGGGAQGPDLAVASGAGVGSSDFLKSTGNMPVETPVETPVEDTKASLADVLTTPTPVRTAVPTYTGKSDAQVSSEAQAKFLLDFGSDPEWQKLLDTYQGDINKAYESLLGTYNPDTGQYEGGTGLLAEARANIESQYGRQEQQAQQGFRESRQALNEQAYLTGRQINQELASRGVSGGLSGLMQTQSQIAQGQSTQQLNQQLADQLATIQENKTNASFNINKQEADIRQNLSSQLLNIKMSLDQQEQSYKQFKGATISSLEQAIRSNNYQDYQVQMSNYNALESQRQSVLNEKYNALDYQINLITSTYDEMITSLDPEADNYDTQLADLKRKKIEALDEAGSTLGLSTGSLVSDIYNNK